MRRRWRETVHGEQEHLRKGLTADTVARMERFVFMGLPGTREQENS